MRAAVLLKDVPDLVEDLELEESGQALAVDVLSYVPSEWDDQALEEALLLKEDGGGTGPVEVHAIAIDTGDIDAMLFSALAKGADSATKLTGDFDRGLTSRQRARILATYLEGQAFDLVLTGVQAVDDLDGQIAGLLAGYLHWPHASVVRDVAVEDGQVRFVQEYAGGVMGEFRADGPVVLGIQAARKPPRYVPIARIRQIQRTSSLSEVSMERPEDAGHLAVRRLYRPESSSHAAMWDGDVDAVAAAIRALLAEKQLGN
jgi:electron transfer flavoprotein beta subunit